LEAQPTGAMVYTSETACNLATYETYTQQHVFLSEADFTWRIAYFALTQGSMAHMPGSSPQTLAIHSIEIMLLDF
jgi:hypothetical protein